MVDTELVLRGYDTKCEYNLLENITTTNTTSAIEARDSYVRFSVYRNLVSTSNGAAPAGGIYARDGASYNIFESCIVSRAKASVLFTNTIEDEPNNYTAYRNKFVNCIFDGNENGIWFGFVNAPIIPAVENEFINCNFYNINGVFFQTNTDNSNTVLTNCNIINSKSTYKKGTYNINAIYNNCNSYNNGSTFPNFGGSNISVDPKFENAAIGNFKLKSDSPIINKGKTTIGVNNDFEGNPRPQGTSHDIGAYEYQEKTTTSIKADAGADQTICAGSSATLTASGGSVYKWSTGATTKSITVSPGATTTYSVTVSEGSDFRYR